LAKGGEKKEKISELEGAQIKKFRKFIQYYQGRGGGKKKKEEKGGGQCG